MAGILVVQWVQIQPCRRLPEGRSPPSAILANTQLSVTRLILLKTDESSLKGDARRQFFYKELHFLLKMGILGG